MTENISMIKVEKLSKEFQDHNRKVHALRNADLDIKKGEAYAIKGPSGSGKTTLLTLMGLLDSPTSGTVWIDGVDVTSIPENRLHEIRSQKIGFVFQNFNLMPYLNASENIELPMELAGLGKAERKEKARELLEVVGLAQRGTHRPSKLSAGEQQRVAIARALANDPPILLADEPTGNLDSKNKKEIVKLFNRLRDQRKMTLVVVTHDSQVANSIGRVARMRDGVLSLNQTKATKYDDDDDD
jgi:putative ABC transport system ATP-binding protein